MVTAQTSCVPSADVFRVVAFLARPHLTKLSIEIARQIKESHGAKTLMYCSTEQERTFYAKAGVFDEIVLHDKMLYETDDSGIVAEQVIARARRIESDYGVTINQLALTNRHLGRGFALGGYYHPRSQQSEQITHLGMIHRLVVQVEFWEQQLKEHQITLFINAPYLLALILDKFAIPMRALCFARLGSRYFWAFDGFDLSPVLERAFRSLQGQDFATPEIAPPTTHMDFRARTLKTRSTSLLLKDLALIVARQVYWRLKGYAKAKGYLVGDRIKGRIRQWRDVRRVTGPEMVSLASLANQPFVFYPLHTEPEKALQTLSPLHFYQLSAIAGVARDLPAGVTLAVKEHAIAAGRRPDLFYDQIMEFKNTVMLDVAELGVQIVDQAAAVITITSTAGLEAALKGKPVVTFGRHNIYNLLPHVRVITDEADLQGALAWATDPSFDRAQALRDGARLAEALRMISFDIPGYSEGRPNDVSPDAAVVCYQHLCESLLEAPYGLAAPAVQE